MITGLWLRACGKLLECIRVRMDATGGNAMSFAVNQIKCGIDGNASIVEKTYFAIIHCHKKKDQVR